MSILIKGMEMPKNCAVCQLERDLFGRAVCFGYGDGRALMQGDLSPVGSEERRPSWCPLVPVPPYGDLIDRREAIIDANERAYDFWLSDNEVNATIQFLNEQTTIIPAEEGE